MGDTGVAFPSPPPAPPAATAPPRSALAPDRDPSSYCRGMKYSARKGGTYTRVRSHLSIKDTGGRKSDRFSGETRRALRDRARTRRATGDDSTRLGSDGLRRKGENRNSLLSRSGAIVRAVDDREKSWGKRSRSARSERASSLPAARPAGAESASYPRTSRLSRGAA